MLHGILHANRKGGLIHFVRFSAWYNVAVAGWIAASVIALICTGFFVKN
jgi:hypothetical protein